MGRLKPAPTCEEGTTVTCAIALSQTLVGALAGLPFSEMLRVMSAESYFRAGQIP
ncbi:MAG TPA: hypothetical protein VFU28_11285 [Vicinamibacterales bacterium]|nr:hypothetical protein [Vicinamibacterales bacterium]